MSTTQMPNPITLDLTHLDPQCNESPIYIYHDGKCVTIDNLHSKNVLNVQTLLGLHSHPYGVYTKSHEIWPIDCRPDLHKPSFRGPAYEEDDEPIEDLESKIMKRFQQKKGRC